MLDRFYYAQAAHDPDVNGPKTVSKTKIHKFAIIFAGGLSCLAYTTVNNYSEPFQMLLSKFCLKFILTCLLPVRAQTTADAPSKRS